MNEQTPTVTQAKVVMIEPLPEDQLQPKIEEPLTVSLPSVPKKVYRSSDGKPLSAKSRGQYRKSGYLVHQQHVNRCPICQNKRLNEEVKELYLNHVSLSTILDIAGKLGFEDLTYRVLVTHVRKTRLYEKKLQELDYLTASLLSEIPGRTQEITADQLLELLKYMYKVQGRIQSDRSLVNVGIQFQQQMSWQGPHGIDLSSKSDEELVAMIQQSEDQQAAPTDDQQETSMDDPQETPKDELEEDQEEVEDHVIMENGHVVTEEEVGDHVFMEEEDHDPVFTEEEVEDCVLLEESQEENPVLERTRQEQEDDSASEQIHVG